MELLKIINIKCPHCNYTNTRYTSWMELGKSSILKAIWCDYCETSTAVRFRFDENKEPEIIKEIPHDEVFMPKKPETGITIKPRSREPKQESHADETG